MAIPLLHLRDIRLDHGGQALLDGAELFVGEGERLCLVGRNGSGKSTLLKIAAGLIEADSGERFVHPAHTVRYLPQEPDLSGFQTTLAFVEAGLAPGDDPHRARYLLEHLGLTGGEDPTRLSGGEARRAALARVLAPEPDILLLDEPTNHLDLPAIEWLEDELKRSRAAMVLISHDRRFLEKLSRATVWLDRGQTRRHERGFAHFEAWRDEVLAQEELDRHKLDRRIAMEEDWLRYGVTARRKRNERRLARLFELRAERRGAKRAAGNVKLTVGEAEASGKLVIEAKEIAKAYDDRRIVEKFSTRIARGDRIGLVGPNGAGKTTLLQLLTGVLQPDSGTVKLGANLEMVSLDQRRESLDDSDTVANVMTGGSGDTVMLPGGAKHVMSYMKDFLFTPEQARQPVSALSGGERGRLMLARALAKPSNLLVLDEPTNDLDLETLDLLQEMLADYAGTVLLVSHDRDFLDRVVTSVIAAEDNGRWIEYAGGYSDMMAQRGGDLAGRPMAGQGKKPTQQGGEKPAAEKKPQKPKLTMREMHLLKTLPDTIERLGAEIARLDKVLADPELFSRTPAKFETAAKAHDKAAAELAGAEEEWLRLEILREEIES